MNRRTFLHRSAITAGVSSLAGCFAAEENSDVSDPVNLSGHKFDYQGGMEIGVHGGPNGQIFYRDEDPQPAAGSVTEGDTSSPEGIAWFHTLLFGLFPYYFDRQERGWEAEVVYATDYSLVDWEIPDGADRPVMPSPTSPETFVDGTELRYVGESGVMGGMGSALHPFSEQSEASSFAETYDGTVYEFDEINRALVESLQESG